jgi:hypothetical protein
MNEEQNIEQSPEDGKSERPEEIFLAVTRASSQKSLRADKNIKYLGIPG